MNQFEQKVLPTYVCELCDYKTSDKSNLTKHFKTIKHKSSTFEQKSTEKVLETTYSDICYIPSSEKNILENIIETENIVLNTLNQSTFSVEQKYYCDICNKLYKGRSGLWQHKKKCKPDSADTSIQQIKGSEADILHMTTLFLESIKQNQEVLLQNHDFQKKMFEMMKDSVGTINSNNSNYSNNTTNNNNKFNLNFFLNETCKDAMNLSEFVDTLQITLADLENVGKLGYTEGISRIFTNGLKALDISKRPIHCSDVKREVVYVKNNNIWVKEIDQLQKAIKLITNKNIKLIPKWKEANPGHHLYHNKRNDDYLKIMYESMGPTDEMEEKNYMVRS